LKFTETPLKGAYVIEIDPVVDSRGFFTRTYCKKEFEEHGIRFDIVQSNISHNIQKGTLRGMHYQEHPYEEDKLVSCIQGAIHDVIVDIRPDSGTYMQWFSIELTASTRNMLYVPKGFAHGFQSLIDNSDVLYLMGSYYVRELSKGFAWNDPSINIDWPIKEGIVISKRDMNFNGFNTI